MSKKNSWLCTYAVAQLGKPYKMGSVGKFKKSTQKTLQQYKHAYSKSAHDNPNYNKSVKTHDCSGLIVGALTCSSVNGKPKGSSPVYHGASSMWKSNCTNRHESMSGFDKVPGRIVFVKNTGKTKSKYPFSHVGIYVGTFKDSTGTHKDAVIEAMGRKYGVVYSGLKKWDAWAQLKCCTVDTSVGQVFTNTGSSARKVNIKVNAIDPYAAVIGAVKVDMDYKKLKTAKVAFMMFNAGSLYDSNHKKKTYKNPYLDDQIKRCTEVNLPFALYADVRAKSEIEADAECRALYYVLAEHSPKLGIWLRMDTNNSLAINDKIINVYYKYITLWGMKTRCGFYMPISKLNTISWSSFQDKFYLWGIDTSLDFKKVEGKLLQPSMFEVK
jgi:hypothetical protein